MLNRRTLLTSMGGAALVMASDKAMADDHTMDHQAMGQPTLSAHRKLVETAAQCIVAGDACIAHCLTAFIAGDTSLALCARTVTEMLSVCASLQKLAALDSPHLPQLAGLALTVCEDCEKECRKHAMHHEVCKACAEACVACADECRKAA